MRCELVLIAIAGVKMVIKTKTESKRKMNSRMNSSRYIHIELSRYSGEAK